jgi:hypothetical protein
MTLGQRSRIHLGLFRAPKSPHILLRGEARSNLYLLAHAGMGTAGMAPW